MVNITVGKIVARSTDDSIHVCRVLLNFDLMYDNPLPLITIT